MVSPAHSPRFAFDRFELDLRSGELRRDGRKIRLQAQPFELLALLIEHGGEVVTRDEVNRVLWPTDTFVDFDHGVAVALNKIREALGDSADNPRFIETLPKRGYRFIAAVEKVGPILSPGASNGEGSGGATATGQQSEAKQIHISGREAESAVSTKRTWLRIATAAALVIAVASIFGARVRRKPVPQLEKYIQLTSFSDSAFSPAISPDGRMIAFIRAKDAGFLTAGEIYSKLLPNGEPVQLTHDGWPKYGVTFSLDGSRVAYTLARNRWDTVTISPLGGEPRTLLSNAAGLTWLDEDHVLFSEIKTGLHMGLVTSTPSRSALREVYTPEHERGMAHYSYASPDRKWVLVVEMGETGFWQRCRLVPFGGSSMGVQVGPLGACESAAWSPDGKGMYFSAYVNGSSHLWRQAFPDGQAEQITWGPTEEEGVAISADGRSLVSAIGMNESGLWLHDGRGEHLISSEGYASLPSLSRDGRLVYYLLRRESPESPQELWMTDLESGKSEPLVQGFRIASYDVSADGKEVIFDSVPAGEKSQLWLASCDHAFGPRMLASSGENTPFFGAKNDVIFRMSEGRDNYLFRMKQDGSERSKVMDRPIIELSGISPDRHWVMAVIPVNEVPTTAQFAVPIEGGDPERICPAICMAKWSPEGGRFYVDPLLQGTEGGMTVAIPVPKGKSLPDLPASGIRSAQDSANLPGSSVLNLSDIDPNHFGYNVAPGLVAGTFIYAKTVVHRNLFRIPVP